MDAFLITMIARYFILQYLESEEQTMEMIKRLCLVVVFTIIVLSLLAGCEMKLNDYSSCEATMSSYYSKKDFEAINIGNATLKDVYDIAPLKPMCVTSYGGFVDYPMRTGGVVRIKFYGPELIVGSIEEIKTNNQP